MDHSKIVTHLEWCAGYGGIHHGLKQAIPNLRLIAVSEIEAYACANLVSKMEAGLMDAVPIWTDLKTFPCEQFRGVVDILSAGFPCQPFSAAGKRGADEDPRHLFPYIKRGVEIIQPSVVFLENVEGILSAKLAGDGWADPSGTPVLLHVLRELERVGYRATAGVFSASEVGAPHQRKRVFILAYRDDEGLEGLRRFNWVYGAEGWEKPSGPVRVSSSVRGTCWPERPGQQQYRWEPPRVTMGNPKSNDKRREPVAAMHGERESVGGSGSNVADPVRIHGRRRESELRRRRRVCSSSEESCGCGQIEPTLGGDLDGAAGWVDYAQLCVSSDSRVDELRLLGNGVVPATAELAFRTLTKRLLNKHA